MKRSHDPSDPALAAYSVARFGVVGTILQHGFDKAADHVSPKRVAAGFGVLLFSYVATGLGGRLLLFWMIAGGVALWRKHQLDEAAIVFGDDTQGYDAFVESGTLREALRQDLRNDWLLSGVPGEQNRPLADRPRFGRKRS